MFQFLLYGGIAIIGWSLYTRNKQLKSVIDDYYEEEEEEYITIPVPAGYRRARQDEVTPAMKEMAASALPQDVGTLLGPYKDRNTGISYYVALETHSNAPKGASVFIQA